MLKLLLPEQRKKIKQEYFRRYASLVLIMLSVLLILFGFSLAPTFLVTKSEASLLKEQVRIAKDPEINKEKISLKNTLTELGNTVNVLDIERYEISSLIDQVTKNQLRGISLSSISFSIKKDPKVGDVGTVSLQGIATGREVLAKFVTSLEAVEKFDSVELPFSIFKKNEDVPFSIEITLHSLDEKPKK